MANILISHPAIAGVAAAEHQGIHESHLFSHTRYVLDGMRPVAEFLEKYSREDYFKLLGIEAGLLRCKEEKVDVFRFFRLLMEEYSRRRSAQYWLEKTPKHAIYYREIVKEFPDAFFVIIRRRFDETLLSNLNKYARPGSTKWRQIIEKLFRYVSDMRSILKLENCAPEKTVTVSYEALLLNYDREISRILDFLGLEKMHLESAYAADSSFKGGNRYNFAITRTDWLLIRLLKYVCEFVPFSLMYRLRVQRDMAETNVFPKFDLIKTAP